MDKKDRKFAVPFNGTNADEYLKLLKPYSNNIEQIYLGIPTLAENHQNILIDRSKTYADILNYEYNCFDFLAKSYDTGIKRFIVLNSPVYNWQTKEYIIFVHQRFSEIVKNFKIDGVIVADFEMGLAIKSVFPDLEIQTSCNAYIWNLNQMRLWEKELGVTTFNPPREILRTRDKLKEMHDAGFRLKCIVNEGCVYGCPTNITHCVHLSHGDDNFYLYCEKCESSNVLKGNWILPRHLKLYDEFVDVYKLVGRLIPSNLLFKNLDSYVNERNDVNLTDCIQGKILKKISNCKFPIKIIPDKLLTCECKECSSIIKEDKRCKICEKIMDKVLYKK